jgi:RNA polymerase sigma factor (sigma-70 family)
VSAKVVLISSGKKWGKRALARRNQLIASHTYLVAPIARHVGKRLPACFDLSDLIDAGIQGLVRAAELYDPAGHNDTPFAAYARTRIKGEILESVRRRHWRENVHPNMDEAPDRGAPPATELEIDSARKLAAVQDAISWLGEPGRSIVQGYYFQNRTLGELARELELNETRIAMLRDEGVTEIRRRVRWRGFQVAA